MVLAADLISTPVREKSATGGRYEYQTMWGLALLFQQHGTNDDYAIVFEFHDDVALLDSATNPTSVRFYQIKSKATNGGWTLTSLLKREKVEPPRVCRRPWVVSHAAISMLSAAA